MHKVLSSYGIVKPTNVKPKPIKPVETTVGGIADSSASLKGIAAIKKSVIPRRDKKYIVFKVSKGE